MFCINFLVLLAAATAAAQTDTSTVTSPPSNLHADVTVQANKCLQPLPNDEYSTTPVVFPAGEDTDSNLPSKRFFQSDLMGRIVDGVRKPVLQMGDTMSNLAARRSINTQPLPFNMSNSVYRDTLPLTNNTTPDMLTSLGAKMIRSMSLRVDQDLPKPKITKDMVETLAKTKHFGSPQAMQVDLLDLNANNSTPPVAASKSLDVVGLVPFNGDIMQVANPTEGDSLDAIDVRLMPDTNTENKAAADQQQLDQQQQEDVEGWGSFEFSQESEIAPFAQLRALSEQLGEEVYPQELADTSDSDSSSKVSPDCSTIDDKSKDNWLKQARPLERMQPLTSEEMCAAITCTRAATGSITQYEEVWLEATELEKQFMLDLLEEELDETSPTTADVVQYTAAWCMEKCPTSGARSLQSHRTIGATAWLLLPTEVESLDKQKSSSHHGIGKSSPHLLPKKMEGTKHKPNTEYIGVPPLDYQGQKGDDKTSNSLLSKLLRKLLKLSNLLLSFKTRSERTSGGRSLGDDDLMELEEFSEKDLPDWLKRDKPLSDFDDTDYEDAVVEASSHKTQGDMETMSNNSPADSAMGSSAIRVIKTEKGNVLLTPKNTPTA